MKINFRRVLIKITLRSPSAKSNIPVTKIDETSLFLGNILSEEDRGTLISIST
jgi:hypothetical protein